MQEKTALNRLGDVILWFGTAVLIVCIAASAIWAYWYIACTEYCGERQLFAIGFAALGLISWLVLASIAYIFNGRSPVAVLKGLFSRT